MEWILHLVSAKPTNMTRREKNGKRLITCSRHGQDKPHTKSSVLLEQCRPRGFYSGILYIFI
jgi:hypothetical protein